MEIPRSVFNYLKIRFKAKIENLANQESGKFQKAKAKDSAMKEEHMRLFRPNLANPANKA